MLGVLHRILGVVHRVLGLLHRVLGVLHRVLGVLHRALGVLHRVLEERKRKRGKLRLTAKGSRALRTPPARCGGRLPPLGTHPPGYLPP